MKDRAMIIQRAALSLGAAHAKSQTHEIRESLLTWGLQPSLETKAGNVADDANITRPLPSHEPPKSDISEEARLLQTSDAAATDSAKETLLGSNLRMLLAIIRIVTGKDARVFDASTLSSASASSSTSAPSPSESSIRPTQAARAGYGVEYDRHETRTETEETNFNADGVIRTADGREIAFEFSLSMVRNYSEESTVSLRLGDAKKIDPLVINFNGNAAELTSQRFMFDLNADGQKENINFATGGSGFLALDKNKDGLINDGSELFGPVSGRGFAELAEYDVDKNGWIDESDAIYSQLQLWMKDEEGNDQFLSLDQANIGAISLSHIDTPFELKDSQNKLQGQIRSSGIYLYEEGRVGSVQQIDLTI